MSKSQFQNYLNQAVTFVWGGVFILFPLFILTTTTDPFMMPKQLLLSLAVLVSLILFAAQMIVTKQVIFRRTPYDLPVVLVLLAFLFSTLFSINRWDSIISFSPVFLAGLSYFLIVNSVKKENSLVFLVSSLLVGACAVSVIAVFSYFKVYPLPLAFTHSQNFTTLGTLLEQLVFLLFLLPITIKEAWPMTKGDTQPRIVSYAAAGLIIMAGILVTIVQLFTTQKPVLLPFDVGFQTAFAAISQDSGRLLQGFLFGSGFGNFAAVFTRFKQASFNTNINWFVPFTESSSLLLELLATTGILGFLSFIFLLFRIVMPYKKKLSNPIFPSLLVIVAATIVLPFSFLGLTILFILLAIFAILDAKKHPSQYDELEFRFVALRKGMFSFQPYTASEKREYYQATAYVVAGILLIFSALFGFYAGRYGLADMTFAKSLAEAQNNNGIQTYRDQVQAITLFPYQSAYYRIFSQTNIALANSLAASVPKGSSPSAQVQNTIVTLIQQGITAGRNATDYSPQSVQDWQNLASVYRSLFGFGQNAENFSVLAGQQAVALDPTNPQEFVALGGIYYQLGQWDNAIRAFQQAIQLKQDYANAYYNLGHAYEQKQDYQDALSAYQAVQQLVASDKTNSEEIAKEIQAVQAKLGQNSQGQNVQPQEKTSATQQQPLQLSSPSQELPTQPTQVPLEGPSVKPTTVPSPTSEASPTPGK